ncbi:MAG TPA: hypothetical protein VG317_21805 [Pseudonocardiaceae bacterium]|nr:hypothetical protein [Pseudonocardiaceae bacterium]
MIVRAAVVPHPPLLVPELVAGAVADTHEVRSACLTAAGALAEVAGDWLAVAADPAGPAVIEPSAVGTFLGYGVHVPVALSEGPLSEGLPGADASLPLPALLAGWLRGAVGARTVRVRLIAPELSTSACRRLGADLFETAVESADPVGLLVLGDGSNRHTERAPARPDDRAAGFDAEVAAALADADSPRLLKLDAALAGELGAVGRAAWQVLAGVGAASGVPWRARALYDAAPFGVAYHVAVWEPAVGS